MADEWRDIAFNLVFMVGTYLVAIRMGPVRVHRRRLQTCLFWSVGGAVVGLAVDWLLDALLGRGLLDMQAYMDLAVGFMSAGAFIGAVTGLLWSIARWPDKDTH